MTRTFLVQSGPSCSDPAFLIVVTELLPEGQKVDYADFFLVPPGRLIDAIKVSIRRQFAATESFWFVYLGAPYYAEQS